MPFSWIFPFGLVVGFGGLDNEPLDVVIDLLVVVLKDTFVVVFVVNLFACVLFKEAVVVLGFVVDNNLV